MALRKPSDFFGNNIQNNIVPVFETDTSLREELVKVESLSEQVNQLQQELTQKVVQTDLEKRVLSQVNVMRENFDVLKIDISKTNRKNINEFKERISELTEIVDNLIENEIPKYKKQITNTDFRIGEKFDSFKKTINENLTDIQQEVQQLSENLEDNLESFHQQLQETTEEVRNNSNTHQKLSKLLENKISKENEKIEEYTKIIVSLRENFIELEKSLESEIQNHQQEIKETFETEFNSISSTIQNKFDILDENVNVFKNDVSSDISSLKADIVVFEHHNKETKKNLEVVEQYIQSHHQELVELKEEVFAEIEKLPIGNVQENLERLERKLEYIEEVYKNIEPEVIVKEVISESTLAEPPSTKNSDPLTPLDQKFVTLDQLQQHYRLFVNRIQQQVASIGGGGEYRFRFLDGIVGIKTNPDAYDGKFLQWNSSTQKAEFIGIDLNPPANVVFITGITTYYEASASDDYIGVNATVPVTIVLPPSPITGKKIIVKDEGNNATTYNITVRAGVGVSVENDTSVIMNINHQSFTYFYNSQNWFLI